MAFDRWARWSYERLLLFQPQVPTGGLWRRGHEYFAVSPGLVPGAVTREGTPLQHWFAQECRAMGAPIRLVADAPSEAQRVDLRTADDLVLLRGNPRSVRDVLVDLQFLLPREFPNFVVAHGDGGPVQLKIGRALAEGESATLQAAWDSLDAGPCAVSVVEGLDAVADAFRSPHRQGDIELMPARRFSPAASRALRFAVEDGG